MCRLRRYVREITPFTKQCFAVSSVILNMVSYGMTTGYNATLFYELRKTREIELDMDSESWLASLIGITLFIGSVLNSLIMETIGRRPAMILSAAFMILGWVSFSVASSFPLLLAGKIFQGVSVGIGGSIGHVLIGEYSTPKYRGPFIAATPAFLLLGVLIAHVFGMFYNWHYLSTILAFFSLPGLILSVLSPESPSFLANKGRYDECRKVFRWLRGTNEDKELEAMLKTAMILKEMNKDANTFAVKIKNYLTYVIMVLKKREFRIPIIIMIHLSAILQFSGSLTSDIYALDVHTALYGTDVYMYKVITSLDIIRLVATFLSVYITSKLKRRLMLLIFVVLNTVLNFCITVYIYLRQHNIVDHIAIGLLLHHLLYFVIGVGCMPLFVIIGGEIFPLEDRGFCLIVTRIFCSVYMFGNLKSAPYLFSSIGVDGTFLSFAVILGYGLVVTYILLPETKDKTLQEVEDEFRGYAIGDHEEAFVLKSDGLKDEVIRDS